MSVILLVAELRGRLNGTLRHAVVQNAFALYALYCSGYLLALVTVPYLSRVLGPSAWGMVAFTQAFGGYLLLAMEYGFSLSATREVACNREARDKLAEVLASALGAKLLLALISFAACFLVQKWVPLFRDHPALFWSGVLWAVLQGSSVLWYFQGIERMRLAVALDALAKTLAIIAVFVFVRAPEDAWKVLALQGGGALLSLVLTLRLAYRDLPFRLPSLAGVLACLRKGASAFIPRNALMMYTVGNSFLLGLFAPPNIVGYYAGADRISRAIVGLLRPASDAIYPRVSNLARASRRDALRLVRITLALAAPIGLIMTLGTFFLAPHLVRILLGKGFDPATPVLRILSLVAVLGAAGNVLGVNWMLPLGLDHAFSLVVIGAGLINLGLGLLLAPHYADIGMAWAVVAAQAFATLGAYVILRWRRLDPLAATVHFGPQLAEPLESSVAGAASEN